MVDIKLSSEYSTLPDASVFEESLGAPFTTSGDRKLSKLVVYQLPDISLPSGRVVASDGFVMDGVPFTRGVPRGTFPLLLGVAAFDDDERVAFAMIQFSKAAVHKWEMALTTDDNPTKLVPDEFHGYGVDSGTGCFADPAAYKIVSDASDPAMQFFDRVTDEMDKVYQHTRSWVSLETEQGSVVLFSSGLGDGAYASFFGFDEQDNVVALVTDFGILDWPKRP